MPDAEPDRRELLKRQAQELLSAAADRATVYVETATRYQAPPIDQDIEKQYLDAHVLIYEFRKRKRDEGF